MASGLENIETIESPFRRFVTTIGVFPTAFTDAMTYYECLAYLVKYLEDSVVPAVNENAEALKELQDYVVHYFDNLDVQDEINNKLDQMAESGELESLISQYIRENMPAITDGYTLTNLNEVGYNTQTNCYYKITDQLDTTKVQYNVGDGLYATVIEGVYLNNADKKITPMSAGLQSKLASCALSYISNASDFTYGGTYTALRPQVTQVDGKWQINCSTFAMLLAYGIDYSHSAYSLGSGNNIVNANFYEDKELLDWFASPNEGQTGDYRWKYTYDLAKHMYELGYCFEPNDDLSNIHTGDMLFMKNQVSTDGGSSTFRDIDHSCIFGWWVSDNSYVVFEVGSLPSAQLYTRSNLENNLVLVGRLSTTPIKEDFEVVSYQQDAVTNSSNVLSNIRCKNFEAGSYYTLVAKIENSSSISDFYPVIYQNTTRIYGYDSATVKPDGNIFIMPFVPANLNQNISLRINASQAGMTQPSTTLTNPIVVKGLLTTADVSRIPFRTCVLSNAQSGFTVTAVQQKDTYAIVQISGDLASGSNYICDLDGIHRFQDIQPCLGNALTSGGIQQDVKYYVDWRSNSARLYARCASAISGATSYIIIPLIQS